MKTVQWQMFQRWKAKHRIKVEAAPLNLIGKGDGRSGLSRGTPSKVRDSPQLRKKSNTDNAFCDQAGTTPLNFKKEIPAVPNPLPQSEFESKEISERHIIFTPEVYQQIYQSIGAFPAEQGGMLGSSDGGKTIDHFYWDRQADTSCVTYSPNVGLINKKILPEWNEIDIKLVGFVHSHPRVSISPSCGDAVYAKNLLTALDEERFYLPIVQSECDGYFRIYGYAAEAEESGLPEIHHYELSVLKQNFTF